jgi:hypothetical protein
MAKSKEIAESTTSNDLELRFRNNQSPEVTRVIEKLNNQYEKFAVTLHELREILDKEMGERTLTEELYRMREDL